ncbi:MAG: helix-turn-helix domain-containing protein [Motiliproteus sp.]
MGELALRTSVPIHAQMPISMLMATTPAPAPQACERASLSKKLLSAAFALSLAGTGTGVRAALPDFLDSPSTSNLRIVSEDLTSKLLAANAVLPASALVSEIQEHLGLNVSQLAEIVGVSRPTIYSWKKGKEEPNEANIDRLMHLKQLMVVVPLEHSVSVGRLLKRTLPTGRNLTEILADTATDVASFSQAYEQLTPAILDATRRSETPRRAPPDDLASSLESRDYPGA